MKKIIIDKPKDIRKNFQKEMSDNEEDSHIKQTEIINKLYLGLDIDKHKRVICELKKKINGYKTQDQKKERYHEQSFINQEELYEKLVVSKLKCHYCGKNVKVIYKYVRDELQWTLDRIDNDLGHSSENTIICCLKCNLKRRVLDSKKFEFTQKLKLIKGT